MLRFLSLASLAAALGFGEFLVLEEDVCVGRCLGKSFFFPHFVFTAGRADVPVPRSFGFLLLRAYAEDLRVFSFSLSSASSQSVLAAHFLSGGWFHSVFVPPRLHFWQSQGTPCHTF